MRTERRFKRWTEDEDEFLRQHHSTMTTREMARRLKRPYDGTKGRVNLLGLNKPGGCIADNPRDNAYMQKVWREIHG